VTGETVLAPDPHPADTHFFRNLSGISLVEFLWGLGMPVVFDSTFLPLFMRHLGASNLVVGLVPTLISAGIAFSSLLAYSLTAGRRKKKTALVAVHVIPRPHGDLETSMPMISGAAPKAKKASAD
jgi:hypothetical protein